MASDNSNPTDNGRTYELHRGVARCQIATTRLDSVSGQNLTLSHQEYQARQVSLSAKPSLWTFITTADCSTGLSRVAPQQFADLRLQVSEFTPRPVIRNVRLSNAGRSRPDGLVVTDSARQL